MSPREWSLIVNPAAGRGEAARLYPLLQARLEAAGHRVTCVTTNAPGHARELARQARAAGAAALVAVGGDGTVHEVLNGLGNSPEAMAGVALGIIPVGTGNSFLRDFGVGSPEAAVERVLAGRQRAVDVGHFTCAAGEQGLFLNLLGIGFIAEVCLLANRRYKGWGAAGYTLAALQALLSLRSYSGTLILDGEERRGRWSMLAVCNSQYTGGAMWIAPPAVTDDGRLDVVALAGGSRLQFVRLLGDVFQGRHLGRPGVSHATARVVEIACEQPLRLMPDGEVYGTTPVRVEIWPGALQLLV